MNMIASAFLVLALLVAPAHAEQFLCQSCEPLVVVPTPTPKPTSTPRPTTTQVPAGCTNGRIDADLGNGEHGIQGLTIFPGQTLRFCSIQSIPWARLRFYLTKLGVYQLVPLTLSVFPPAGDAPCLDKTRSCTFLGSLVGTYYVEIRNLSLEERAVIHVTWNTN